jgi:hypothetical protein
VQRIEIDGVPLFTSPGPGRASGALVFGVGLRDESYARLGITHLIEHLVMGSLPKSHLDCNATVDVESTIFYATGRPAAVAGFLAGVCAALSELPVDRMDKEIGVLQAENCTGSHPTAAVLWGARFRLDGPGLALAGGGVPEWLTETAVREHARKWFVRGNAAALWHGDRPEDLRLSLPDGPRPERIRPAVRVNPGPVWLQGPTAGAGLLLTVSDALDPATGVGVDVLNERMRDVARMERGLSYHSDLEIVDVAPGHREVAVVVDARDGQEAAVAQVLWEQYLDLCERGPSQAELEHAVEGYAEHLDSGDDAALGDLSRAAFAEVFGLPFRPAADGVVAWSTVTPEQVAAAMRACRPSAVLALPEKVDPGPLPGGIERTYLCNYVPELPSGTTFRPSLLARAVNKQARIKLVVTDAYLAHGDSDGDGHVIPWPEVEAAVPALEGNGVFVVGRNLCGIDVHEDVYGRRAVDMVRAQLPAHVWVTVPAPTAGEVPAPAGAR